MTESRKRRPRTRTVLPAGSVPEPTSIVVSGKDSAVAFVEPTIKKMLLDAKLIVATELGQLRENGTLGDSTGQRIRNIVATIGQLMENEKKAMEGMGGMEGMTSAEMIAALEAELARLKGEPKEEP